jgi:pre-mRNA-splicing factor ATP-dependent RNA helicase DHX16
MLKSMGVENLVDFDFLDPPPHDMLVRGLEMLYALGALNDRGELTRLGRRMAEFPLEPMLAKMLIRSEHYRCIDQAVTICAMLSVGNAPEETTWPCCTSTTHGRTSSSARSGARTTSCR